MQGLENYLCVRASYVLEYGRKEIEDDDVKKITSSLLRHDQTFDKNIL